MSFDYSDFPDPYSIAVPFDLAPRDPWKSYDVELPDEDGYKDPTFGMDAFNACFSGIFPDSLPEAPPTHLHLERMRFAIESMSQTHAVILTSYHESQQLCCRNYQSMLESFQKGIDGMYQLSFNERAWHSFLTILMHRSALSDRRFKRHPEQDSARKAALSGHFGIFQMKWKCLRAWSHISFRYLPVTRRFTRSEHLKSFQMKWKRFNSWSDVVCKFRSITRRFPWQKMRMGFQTKWKRFNSWSNVVCKLRSSTRLFSWQKLQTGFQMKWKRLYSWSETASQLLSVTRQSARQGRVEKFQKKWKCAEAWSDTTEKLKFFVHNANLHRYIEEIQVKCKRRELWSDFKIGIFSLNSRVSSVFTAQWKTDKSDFTARCASIVTKWAVKTSKAAYASGSARVKKWKFIASWSITVSRLIKERHNTTRDCNVQSATFAKELEERAVNLRKMWSILILSVEKECRDTKRLLIKLNHRDIVNTAIANWTRLLDNRNSVSTVFFNRAHMLSTWSRFCRKYFLFSKFWLLHEQEMTHDMKKMVKKYRGVFQDENERIDPRNISFFDSTLGRWPKFWQSFKKTTMYTLSKTRFEERSRIKNLHMEIFCLVKVFSVDVEQGTEFVCADPGRSYLDDVQRMFEVKLFGNVAIDWSDSTLTFYIPRTAQMPNSRISFSIQLQNVESIVRCYYSSGNNIAAAFLGYFPNVLSLYKELNPVNSFELNSGIRRLKINLIMKFVQRFFVGYTIDTNNSLRVIIKCRMVRKSDGNIVFHSQIHEYGLYEALEQFGRGMFDTLLDKVIRLEESLKIQHRYGRLLEHYVASD